MRTFVRTGDNWHALAVAMILTATIACGGSAPSPVTKPPIATTTWSWRCCGDRYHGTMSVQQDGSRIAGTFHDDVAGTGGTIEGTLDGTNLDFVRSVSGGKQHFVLTFSEDGSTASGTISGSWISGSNDAHVQRGDR